LVLTSLLLAFALAASDTPADADAGKKAAEAHQLTVQSIREYNAADFEASLRDAKRAYELSGLPGILFNLGQCHRMLGHWKEAEFSYQRYLREKKDAPNRAEVLALIEQVKEQERRAAATPTPTPIATPAPTPTTIVLPTPVTEPVVPAPFEAVSEAPAKGGIPAATWWLGGSGAALAVGGGVLGVLANMNGNNDSGINHSVTGANYVTGQYEGLTADILWGVGGALVVAAIVVAFTSH
jgi:tetratricopeptide (TPR) repeat protein